MSKRQIVHLSPDQIVHVPGAVEVWPGCSFHILHYHNNRPYVRLCDDSDGSAHQRSGLTAPAGAWCRTCVQEYSRLLARHRQNLTVLPPYPDPALVIVATGPTWTHWSVRSAIVPAGTGLSDSKRIMARFEAELQDAADPYGYSVRWDPDYTPLPVLLADQPDYVFDWSALLYLAWEHTRTWWQQENAPPPWTPGQTYWKPGS